MRRFVLALAFAIALVTQAITAPREATSPARQVDPGTLLEVGMSEKSVARLLGEPDWAVGPGIGFTRWAGYSERGVQVFFLDQQVSKIAPLPVR